ncbi:12235_t:CDS:2 [Entrophospora sp. SA101]|nr:12235_t:CDS:2 [Entrophospora sp. SA101]
MRVQENYSIISNQFKNRHHIKQYFKSGEANSAPLETLGNERKLLKEVIQDYESRDVYNVDETALYWNLEPSKTLSDHFISGTKKSKDRVTIVLTCNADGSDKLTPLFIHKWQTPRVLRGIKKDDLPYEEDIQYNEITSSFSSQYSNDLNNKSFKRLND